MTEASSKLQNLLKMSQSSTTFKAENFENNPFQKNKNNFSMPKFNKTYKNSNTDPKYKTSRKTYRVNHNHNFHSTGKFWKKTTMISDPTTLTTNSKHYISRSFFDITSKSKFRRGLSPTPIYENTQTNLNTEATVETFTGTANQYQKNQNNQNKINIESTDEFSSVKSDVNQVNNVEDWLNKNKYKDFTHKLGKPKGDNNCSHQLQIHGNKKDSVNINPSRGPRINDMMVDYILRGADGSDEVTEPKYIG